MSPGLKKRLPLLAFLLLGLVLWKGGFGLLASERTVVWQLPLAYGEIRQVDLQVWDGEALVARTERTFPGGVTEELRVTATLSRGTKRGLAAVTLADGGVQALATEFDPGADGLVVLAPRPR